MARSEHHSFEPCALMVVFDSSKDTSLWPLYWQYIGNSEQYYNAMLFSHKIQENPADAKVMRDSTVIPRWPSAAILDIIEPEIVPFDPPTP